MGAVRLQRPGWTRGGRNAYSPPLRSSFVEGASPLTTRFDAGQVGARAGMEARQGQDPVCRLQCSMTARSERSANQSEVVRDAQNKRGASAVLKRGRCGNGFRDERPNVDECD